MLLVALEPIAVARGVTIAAGESFEANEHALSERDVAQLLDIAAATAAPTAGGPERSAPLPRKQGPGKGMRQVAGYAP